MPPTILGLDIGGANLKAATPDKRAVSVPFALWKQSNKLPTALADLVSRFPDTAELVITMTGELCDCYETRREGVNAIIEAVKLAGRGQRIRVWSTDGVFVEPEAAARDYLKVASVNWYALATFAGRFAPKDGALLIDVGSTTTDLIPLSNGVPCHFCATDRDRLLLRELVYVGVRRTPVCALGLDRTCAEYFATVQDAFVVLGLFPENPDEHETADGRPLTITHSRARLARMLGGDIETLSRDELWNFAVRVHRRVVDAIVGGCRDVCSRQGEAATIRTVIASGTGEFLVKEIVGKLWTQAVEVVSLSGRLGPQVSACAPAYAVAVLASEQP